ncbi:hypothetical protein ABER52_11685 [Geobacillus stearothermophilus]|uniref:hypothetical protein n=1 Tax=Geobacillus stearothermophilus TaxID=1422 RepID=UPI002E22B4E1|nr:hypothetical protein [Geobacillus stearothermophilus]
MLRLLHEAADILHRYAAELNREWKRIGEALGKRKLRAKNRTEAVAKALRLGLIR